MKRKFHGFGHVASNSVGKFGESNVHGITLGLDKGIALFLAIVLLKKTKRDEDKPIEHFVEELIS